MRSVSKSYRDLIAWQRAMDIVVAIYQATALSPTEERYGLTSQLPAGCGLGAKQHCRRAGPHGVAEFRHFLRQASGSLMELETQVLIAERLHYLTPDDAGHLLSHAAEVGRILNGLLKSLTI